MSKRSVGLQKELPAIFEGVHIPGEAAADGLVCARRPERTAESARPDPIALFEKIARMQRRRLSIWSRLKSTFSPRA